MTASVKENRIGFDEERLMDSDFSNGDPTKLGSGRTPSPAPNCIVLRDLEPAN
jgi:hypothetical protein